MRAYLDTSALLKLLVQEDESPALRAYIRSNNLEVATSEYSLIEVRRNADWLGVDPIRTEALLAGLYLVLIDRRTIRRAGLVPNVRRSRDRSGFVRSADALHIAVAETLPDLEAFVTYDVRQADAARLLGMQVVSPGSALASPGGG